MSGRVLASPEAQQAITRMLSILNSNFEGTIRDLDNCGQELSDPSVWDGNLASSFRSETWPQCNSALKNVLTQLTELQGKLNVIQTNIMTAGGNQ